MKIHWHKRADAALHQIEDYVLQEFGELGRIQNRPQLLLDQLCEGDDALLVVQKQANAYIYRLNPNLTRP